VSRLSDDRVAALSEQLIEAHRTLRERLASLRGQVADGTARPRFPENLLGHCLSFCGAVHTHHTSEDNQVFPALRAAAPELAPVIDKLTEDHTLVAGILQRVRELLESWSVTPPAALLREHDGLTARVSAGGSCAGAASYAGARGMMPCH
jgi:iron-sulfur cluster repair protein YtfE (RIC family)